MNGESADSSFKWKHPSEVMQMQKLKRKQKALQARIASSTCSGRNAAASVSNIRSSVKRKNPFLKNAMNEESNEAKRARSTSLIEPSLDESSDSTLFKLFNFSQESAKLGKEHHVNFSNILKADDEQIKSGGEKWIPIDWSLKKKVRFLSAKPFTWSQTLRISEEASGVTGFARCLDINKTDTTLDTSSNSKFHQCCLYWQQPSIPWLKLFPRSNTKATQSTMALTSHIKESMHLAWMSSLRSLFHLLRMRQCPFFYACANTFTVLFRAAGIAGFSEMHAVISPTTRGFRHLLKQEEIEFTMPLKGDSRTKISEDQDEDEEEQTDEKWLKSMGINSEDIKQINYTQDKIIQKHECEVDHSELSLVLIQGVEVQAFYSFLIHCKSAISQTGLFAGVPPTLLAPVAFHGGCLMPLEVRQSKVHIDNEDFHSLDLSGPVLPHCVHNLCALQPMDNSITATFSSLSDTIAFSKITHQHANAKDESSAECQGSRVFNQENLSDCGLSPSILKHFCSNDCKLITHVESLKYSSDNFKYSWT